MRGPPLPLMIVIALLAMWEWLSRNISGISFFFSSPSSVAQTLWQHTADGILPIDFIYTALPTSAGFALSVVIGTCVGLLLAANPRKATTFRIYVSVLANFPIFAIAPMMIVFFGIGLQMKLALALFSTIFVTISQAYDGAMAVTPRQREVVRSFGASNWQVVRLVLLPGSISWIASGMRVTAGLALLGTFIGEFMASEYGLGHRMLRGGALYDVSYVLACAIYMVCLVLIMNWGANIIEKQKLSLIQALTVNPILWTRSEPR